MLTRKEREMMMRMAMMEEILDNITEVNVH